MSTLYELKSILREFKGRTVLDIRHLLIETGKIYSLIGPNGAGKTTLLQLLAFLDQPSSGELFFHGVPVRYTAPELLLARRRVVLLDQYPILFTGPVWKNVEYGLKIRGVKAGERRKRVDEMLDLVGMHRFYEADAHKLSGGETKRVALARALALRPEVLLCDEPGANVDKENQEIILSILESVNKDDNTTIIFSTHYLSQGRSLADHTLMLEHGSLSDVVPENVYRAVVIRREGERVLCQAAGRLLVSLPGHLLPATARSAKLQIDPEGVEVLAGPASSDGRNVVSGIVIHISQDRGRVRLGLDLEAKLCFFMSMKDYLQNPPVIGGKMTVHFPDSSLHSVSSW